jgi:hypothetical protein
MLKAAWRQAGVNVRAALLHSGAPRPARRLVDAIRTGSCEWCLFSCGVNGVVRVNFVLGKGLHSYGFGIGGETYVATFIVLDLLFVAFAIWQYRTSKSAVAPAGQIEGERVTV